jgi:hypothetical protein
LKTERESKKEGAQEKPVRPERPKKTEKTETTDLIFN